MWRNYLISAWRNMMRHRMEALINVLGLAAGISAAMLIFLYVKSEKSYDRHHESAERIFRLNSHMELDGQVDVIARNSLRAAPELMAEYPEIEDYCRVFDIGKQSIWYGTKMFAEEGVCFADSSYFRLFTYPFVAGNPATCLDKPMQIAISHKVAEKYFGSADEAMGKMLKFTLKSYMVTGVFESGTRETHLPFEFIISMSSLNPGFYQGAMGDYFRMMTFTYLLLGKDVSPEQLSAKFAGFYTAHITPWIKQNEVNGSLTFSLQPLASIHLSNEYGYDYAGNSNASYLYIFSIVGIFILLVAAINYMNLSTARSGRRAKEVGIRMVAGASRPQLILQFLSESLFTSLIALIVALGLVELLMPMFNSLTDKSFDHASLFVGGNLLMLTGMTLLLALLAGSYPAFFLSSIKPIEAIKLKGGKTTSLNGWKRFLGPAQLRRGLVVLQFTIAVALIVATFVVYGQLDYMRNKDLGFNKDGILVIRVPGDSVTQGSLPTIRNEFSSRSDVKALSSVSEIPGGKFGELYFVVNQRGERNNKILGFMFIDQSFFPMLDIPVEGRNFDINNAADPQAAFIINEACAKFLGWENPIGQDMENGFGLRGKVVGVVKDFNYSSLHNPIEPMVFMFNPQNASNLLIRVGGDDISHSVDAILERWKGFVPNHPLESYFLDDFMNRNYLRETKMLSLFGYFSALTVLISCLGLFGLAAFSTEQRTKEIGIRKVMGASVGMISALLTREFLLLVLLGNLLALPAAWYFMNHWLEDFAFRISLSPMPFIGAGVLSFLVALITVSWLAVKAASSNPIKTLRYE